MDSTKILTSLLNIIEDLEGASTPTTGNLVGVSVLTIGNLEAAPAPIPLTSALCNTYGRTITNQIVSHFIVLN